MIDILRDYLTGAASPEFVQTIDDTHAAIDTFELPDYSDAFVEILMMDDEVDQGQTVQQIYDQTRDIQFVLHRALGVTASDEARVDHLRRWVTEVAPATEAGSLVAMKYTTPANSVVPATEGLVDAAPPPHREIYLSVEVAEWSEIQALIPYLALFVPGVEAQVRMLWTKMMNLNGFAPGRDTLTLHVVGVLSPKVASTYVSIELKYLEDSGSFDDSTSGELAFVLRYVWEPAKELRAKK